MLLAFALLATLDSAQVRDIPVAPAETLHVTIVGEGRPVVLVPGLIACAYAFRNVIPLLEEAGVQTIVIEPLGVGASGRPSKSDFGLTAQAERIAAVLDSLGVRHALIAAHSVSVSMVLRLAYRRPELVSGVLAINGGPVESAATPGVRKAAKYAFLIRIFAGPDRIRRELRKGLIETAGDSSWVTPDVIDAYTAAGAGKLGAVLDVMKGMARSREPELLAPRLSEIMVPVRLLVGGAPGGSGVPRGLADTMQAHLRAFTVDTLAGVGLHIHEEQPWLVAQELLRMEQETRADR